MVRLSISTSSASSLPNSADSSTLCRLLSDRIWIGPEQHFLLSRILSPRQLFCFPCYAATETSVACLHIGLIPSCEVRWRTQLLSLVRRWIQEQPPSEQPGRRLTWFVQKCLSWRQIPDMFEWLPATVFKCSNPECIAPKSPQKHRPKSVLLSEQIVNQVFKFA